MQVSFYLKRANAEGATALFSRLTYAGYKVKYFCPEKIEPKYWDTGSHRAKRTKSFPEYPEFNQRLDDFEGTIKTIYRRWVIENEEQQPTPEELKLVLDAHFKKDTSSPATKSVISFLKDLITRSKAGTRLHHKTGKPIHANTIKTYKTTLAHLTEFQKTRKRRIEFNTIDLDFYEDYKAYFITEKKLKVNTAGKHIQLLKTILNEAAEMGLHTNTAHRGKRFVTLREEADNIYLTAEEVDALERLNLEDHPRLDRVRDLFLIGIHTGQRFSDYSRINPEMIGQDGFIHLIQVKTKNKVAIPLHPTVQRIFEKYTDTSLPEISEQKFNAYVKEIGQLIPSLCKSTPKSFTQGGIAVTQNLERWKQLSSHTARRTFATLWYRSGKVPAITIMAITGHTTEKNFLRYIKATPTDHARMMPISWNATGNKKIISQY